MSVQIYRTRAEAGDICECGADFCLGEACYTYDIGGGSAIACLTCVREALADGTAAIVPQTPNIYRYDNDGRIVQATR